MWQEMIVALHDDADMTFAQIGDRIGLKRNSVHDIYHGETKQPGYDVCNKIKRLHGIKFRKKAS